MMTSCLILLRSHFVAHVGQVLASQLSTREAERAYGVEERATGAGRRRPGLASALTSWPDVRR